MLLLALLALPLLTLTGCGVEVVEPGEVGVKKSTGTVEEQPLLPGFYTYNPFLSSITIMDTQLQRFDSKTEVYTKDVQQAAITYTVNYSLKPSSAVSVYVNVGLEWEHKIIPQVVQASIKNSIGKWNAIDLISNRDKATTEMENYVKSQLDNRGIIITKLELTDISYDPAFEQAVESKVIAVQKAEEAKNKTVQVQEEANQRIIAAKADAEAMSIKTEALSKSQSLVAYEAVLRWDGKLPQYMMGETVPMINIPTKY